MRLTLSFLCLLLFSAPVFAQNWRTVNPHDTVYFRNIDPNNNTGIVRMITIDSVRQKNGDSLFYFFRSVRAYQIMVCMDTAAPSWMGARCQRKTDGTEFYFNGHSDTVRIKTRAVVSDSWIAASDTFGNDYWATVMSADTMTIDGVLDSVKTCSIQAKNGNYPFANYNNGLRFKWSKNHGWVNTLDWFAFPNTTQLQTGFGLCLLPFVFERLPMTFNAKDFSQPDLLWKYAPGNEWFNVEHSGFSPGPAIYVYTYDSVISSTAMNTNTVIATLMEIVQVKKLKANGSLDTVYTTNNIKTDTVTITYNPVRSNVFPEMKEQTFMGDKGLHTYTLNPFCGDRNVFSDSFQTMSYYNGAILNNCPMIIPGSSPKYYLGKSTYLDGFGEIASTISQHFNGPGVQSSDMAYSYLKLGNCVKGNKNMPWLGVNEPRIQSNFVSVYPNPANDNVTISVSETSDVSILDITGRLVNTAHLSKGDNHLSVADLPAGMYILRVSGKDKVLTQKLIKN